MAVRSLRVCAAIGLLVTIMAVDKTKTTSTTTTLPPLSSFLGGPSGSTGSKNPTSQSQLVQGQVSGVGSLLGLKWGNVSVATAVTGLEELAKKANGNSTQAQQAATVLDRKSVV